MDRITGRTRLLGIVGDPIAQVGSPAICNPHLAAAGIDAVLIPFHVPAARFEAVLPGLLGLANLDGLLITIPFKTRVLAYAARLGPVAQAVGAANALRREADGSWTAEMFDGAGLLGALAGLGIDPAGRAVLLLGAGGAGAAIAVSLARAGVARLGIHDLDAARAAALAARVMRHAPGCAAERAAPIAAGYDLLINATPVGMAASDRLPAALGPLAGLQGVVDIVPYPPITRLMEEAGAAGCRVAGGQAMIAGQADAVLRFFGMPIGPADGGATPHPV
ncbi:MAG: shikimate dehydrogenase [Rhodospirillales bacterium]|nr:shikimate dehydrogenase [Rhodospirillales bacterium]